MSNNRVTSFAEDSFGHIWIGTFRGLNKSTMHEYHQYFCTEGSHSIPDNQVQVLHRDSAGRLWVGTVNGLCVYTDTDDFRRIPMDSGSRNIVQILEDKSGRIFASNSESLFVYDEESGCLVHAIERLDLMRSYFSRCFVGPSDDIFVVGSSEIICYGTDLESPKWKIPLRREYPFYSFMSDDGVIWLCTSGHVDAFDTKLSGYVRTPLEDHHSFRNSCVDLIFPYGPETLLLNIQGGGLFVYNRNTGEVLGQNDGGFPFKAPDFIVNTIFRDSRDNLWIGSYDQSYTVIYNYKERFNTDAVLRSAFENVSVYSMDCDGDGNLWCVTLHNDLYVYMPGRNELKKIEPVAKGRNMIVYAGHDDEIWIGTLNSVLRCRWDGCRLSLLSEHYVPGPMSMALAEDGVMWIGTAGPMVYCVSDGGLREFGPLSYGYTFSSALLPSGSKLLVAAFKEGLCEISPGNGEVEKADVVQSCWQTCIRRSVFVPTCLFRDSFGDVWVGTMANGLMKYTPSTGEIIPVPGTPCTDICSIEEDLHGNLWVSTQYGLGKYDRSVSEFVNWYTADGIGGNQFYDRSSCIMKDGRIVFGGTHGVTVFDPVDVMPDRDIAVCFENIRLHNRLVRPSEGNCIEKALPWLPEIKLEHRQNSFSISFSAIEYGEYERVRYFWKMDGFDGYWIDAGNNREAYYANLPSGKYRFKVRITDYDRNVVLAENSIPVIVMPPMWLSWQALVLYAGFLCFVVWGLFRMRRQISDEKRAKEREMMEKIQEKKVNEMNMSFFANISHEFRTPLTMISGPVAQLRQSDSVSEEDRRLLNIVQRNIRRMLRLVNQLMDFNKLENDTLHLKVRQVDIVSQLCGLADIFRVTAEEKGISFKTYGLEDNLVMWADDDKLDKICFNLLSNAMKFTASGGKVELSLDMLSRDDAMAHFFLSDCDTDSRYVKIVVRDTGPGIPENQLERIFERYYQLENQMRGAYNWGTGIGLYFARTLAVMHHGYLKAGNRSSCRGAEFTLLLPASESSYAEHEKTGKGVAELNLLYKDNIRYTRLTDGRKDAPMQAVLVVDDDAD
ncbi:MAG: hybrid sensor histidine kinase/response regulator, partial [Bacteroidales bacterium]|nr:hybrid sensor histidine kinase/response regulator [Bacteroidales bacterium]